MRKTANNLAKWIDEEGKRRQKNCKSPQKAREMEDEKKKQVHAEKQFRLEKAKAAENLQQSMEGVRKDVVSEGSESRSDGRSVPIGIGGVVSSLGAQAATKEELQLMKEADKAASRLENLYARTYTDVLLATGKSEGWTFEEQEKARKAAGLQFKAGLPRPGRGDQKDIFVTCILAGHALGVFDKKDVSLFLYGAQVMATGGKTR